MKLLFYSDTVFSFGGVQRVLAEITKKLAELHDVTILSLDTDTDLSMYGYEKSNVKFDYIKYGKVPPIERLLCKGYSFLFKKILPQNKKTSYLYARSSFLPTYRKALTEKINGGGYDIVIAVHSFLSLHLAAISSRINARSVAWIHNSYEALFEKSSPYLPNLEKHFGLQMKYIDEVVVLSFSDKKRFETKMNLSTKVIYNPLTVKPQGEGNATHKRFIGVGRFSFGHKGFDLLIQAFALFLHHRTDWSLEIVGEGPELPLYQRLISEHQLEGKVILSTFTKEIQKHYAASSVYVLSSRWEGFGLVLLEAMSHGLPIIASDLPVTHELLDKKGVAIFFENGNITHLAECLKYMAEKADLAKMKERALTYSSEFSINKITERWDKLFKNMM